MSSTTLYRHFDNENNLLYVGISLHWNKRTKEHEIGSPWFKEVKTLKMEEFETREEAIKAEKNAIRLENPKHNVQRYHIKSSPKPKELTLGFSQGLFLKKHVSFQMSYTLDEAAYALSMKKSDIETHIAKGDISFYTVLGGWSYKKQKHLTKIRITGWSLIDFLEYKESQQGEKS